MSNIEEKLGNIAVNNKSLLNGFKILGVFPFYLNYIRVDTNIDIALLKIKLRKIKGEETPTIDDFYDPILLQKIKPIIDELITVALINNRFLGFLLKPFVKLKVRQCSHRQIFLLYKKIVELSDGGFFLTYWIEMMKKSHVILKTGNQ